MMAVPKLRISTLLIFLFLVLVASCSGNHPASSEIGLSASATQVVVGQYVLLTATVAEDPNAKVNWSVNGIPNGNPTVGAIVSATEGGTTTTNALSARYSPPANVPSSPSVTVSVALQSDTANQAMVTILVGPDVTISPGEPEVNTNGTQQFSANVIGTSDPQIAWEIGCSTGGSACGTISQTGFYSAPSSVPTVLQGTNVVAQNVTVTATVIQGPQFPATASIIVVPPNQAKQPLPIQLGTSGSNANSSCASGGCVGGTYGALLNRAGTNYILTNWHVAIGSDGGVIGDSFVQPGLTDAECEVAGTDPVANLSQLLDPQTQTGDRVDVALAEVKNGAVDASGLILELGSSVVNGVPQPGAPASGAGTIAAVGELVAKSGRTTGLTCGEVETINASTTITYSEACSTNTYSVQFSNQVIVSGTGFLAAGDSGSLLVDQSTAEPIALLFAGDGNSATGNPVSDVLSALKDSNGNMPVFVGGTQHVVAGCGNSSPASVSRDAKRLAPAAVQLAIAIKEKYADQLMQDPAVRGVGVGVSEYQANQPVLDVYILKGSPHTAIPQTIEGLPVRVIATTGFRAGVANSNLHLCDAPQRELRPQTR